VNYCSSICEFGACRPGVSSFGQNNGYENPNTAAAEGDDGVYRAIITVVVSAKDVDRMRPTNRTLDVVLCQRLSAGAFVCGGSEACE
jgi:hypothetical protein